MRILIILVVVAISTLAHAEPGDRQFIALHEETEAFVRSLNAEALEQYGLIAPDEIKEILSEMKFHNRVSLKCHKRPNTVNATNANITDFENYPYSPSAALEGVDALQTLSIVAALCYEKMELMDVDHLLHRVFRHAKALSRLTEDRLSQGITVEARK
jgi:hypothetical protein